MTPKRAAGALWAAALAVVLLVAAPALAAPAFPALTGRVVDQAGIIPPDAEAELDRKLAALEARTTDQLVVVTLSSLGDYEISDYGYQLGRHWRIGQAGKNNGVLLIVAPNERKVRIEVGYGLEPVMTDALSSVIIQSAILPRFKAGDYPGGINAGVDEIVTQLTLDPAEAATRAKAAKAPTSDFDFGLIIVLVLVALFVLSSLGRAMRARGDHGWVWVLLSILTSSGGRGSRGGGGWSSGGGFGGGGGSFGGGGSSGSW